MSASAVPGRSGLFRVPQVPQVHPDRPGGLLRLLEAARKNVILYLPGHPQVTQTLADLHAAATLVLAPRPGVRFDIYEDAFFLDNRLLLEESVHAQGLLTDLARQDVGSIELLHGITLAETTRFAELLAASADDAINLPQAASQLNLRYVRLGPPRTLRADERQEVEVDSREVYRIGLRTMEGLNYEAVRGAPLNLRNARLLVTSMLDAILRDRHALLGVAAIRQHDEDTCHHSVSVAILSLMIAFRIGLDQPSLAALGTAALLHDVGKMRIPRAILNKPGRLSPDERAVIARHPIYGAELLRTLTGYSRAAMLVALQHHMNFDLSGYPRVNGDRQHVFTRVIAIADYFDAVTSARRMYRRPMLPDRAMRDIVTGAGSQFDPALAKAFVQVLGAYPVGSVVLLSSGETAVAYRPTEGAPLRPVVKIVRDRYGKECDPYLVDTSRGTRHVERCVDPADARIDPAAYL